MFSMDLPFARGTTPMAGQTAATSTPYDLEQYVGKKYLVWDSTFQEPVLLLCVRNTSTITLAKERLAAFASGAQWKYIDGYTRLPGARGFPIDYLHTAGIPTFDLGYLVIGGPTTVLTALEADATNVITADTPVMAGTAVTSQATSAGRLTSGTFAITGNTGPQLWQDIMNQHMAQTARTTANTNTSTKVRVTWRW